MRSGRPLRFLGSVAVGWIGLRVLVLWPAPPPVVPVAVAEAATAETAPAPVVLGPLAAPTPVRVVEAAIPIRIIVRSAQPLARAPLAEPVSRPHPPSSPSPVVAAAAAPAPSPPVAQALVPVPPASARSPSRWSAGVYAVVRGAGRGGGLGASQLGGSQVGARVAYALDRRVSAVARVASPLGRGAREAAIGLEWRPLDAPVRLFAEQRIGLGRARGGPSAGVIAGLDERLPRGFRLEAYGQAGVIGRDRVEGFADGAARLTRPVTSLGKAKLDVGVGAWGAARRGAERLDVGPTFGLAVPVGGRTARVALDWRERVAGRSRPGSGPALSIGAEF